MKELTKKTRNILIIAAVAVVVIALAVALPLTLVGRGGGGGGEISVAAGETHVVSATTTASKLTIAEGGAITAPQGKSLTMTVDGVETGQALTTTKGADTHILPGTYQGNIVLTVTDANQVGQFPFRQALYLDSSGVVEAKSVLAAVGGQKPTGSSIKDLQITSTGECFNGICVAGGSYTFINPKITFTGNGRSDFAGYGAAVLANGTGTTVVLDHATIENKGVVRTGVVATGGSNVIVKNSTIRTSNGVLPADYAPTIDTTQMRSVPWMLALSGNVRATNLLGANTKASYINSYIGSEGWGVLSTDGCTTPVLTAINSTIAITGPDGYGSYAIGNATENFLGTTFNVATYATINRGGNIHYGDSDAAAVADLNTSLGLGLTADELAALPKQNTVINSNRFGVMWHGSGTVDVTGGTVFNTKEATFLDKGQTVTVTVDGSGGAQLNPGNGIIFQLMENDDPGSTTGTYTVPTTPPARNASWDLTSTSGATLVFSNITLKGDFYNAIRGSSTSSSTGGAPSGGAGGTPPSSAAPPSGATPTTGGAAGGPPETPAGATPPPTSAGGGPPETPPTGGTTTTAASGGTPPGGAGGSPPGGGGGAGLNMVLTFQNSTITGVISASEGHYAEGITVLSEANFHQLGTITNTTGPAVNNGVIVTLKSSSKWIVAGTSYLTSLTLSSDSTVTAVSGKTLTMTVNGVATDIVPGKTYTGAIVLTVK